MFEIICFITWLYYNSSNNHTPIGQCIKRRNRIRDKNFGLGVWKHITHRGPTNFTANWHS